MNYIDQIFNRCRMETLCDFLMHGSESIGTSDDNYYERAKKAEKQLNEWLYEQFGDSRERDEPFSLIYSVLGDMQSIYMQIGLQAGMMLVSEFYDKKNNRA